MRSCRSHNRAGPCRTGPSIIDTDPDENLDLVGTDVVGPACGIALVSMSFRKNELVQPRKQGRERVVHSATETSKQILMPANKHDEGVDILNVHATSRYGIVT